MRTALKLLASGALGGGLNPDYQEVLAYAQSQGITIPSAAENALISDLLINPLDQAGLWARCKTANVFGFGSSAFGTLNLKDSTTFRFIAQGTTPTFTQGAGTKSAGAGSCWNTKYKTNQYSGIETDITVVIDVNEGGGVLGRLFGAFTNATPARHNLNPMLSTSSLSRYGHNANPQLTAPNYDSFGLYVMTNTATQNIIWVSGGKTATNTTHVAPSFSNDELLLAQNSSTTDGGLTVDGAYTRNICCLFRFDQFDDDDEATFRAIWENFKFTAYTYSSNVYWVRPAGSTYGAGTGADYANAVAGFSAIPALSHGDRVMICGTHLEKLTVNKSYVTYDLSYDADPGIIDGEGLRTECIDVPGFKYVTIIGKLGLANQLTDATASCIQFYLESYGNVVRNLDASFSGNQAFQHEGSSVTYYNVTAHDCVDDGWSGHQRSRIVLNECEAYDNNQNVNAISNSVIIANNSTFSDPGSVNAQPQDDADFTFNNCTFNNGLINGGSTVALKLNQCTLNSSSTSGNVTINP